jgi:signal transduction histidine kinase
MARLRGFDLRLVDRTVAVVLTVVGLFATAAALHHGLGLVGLVSCVVFTATVAWRRVSAVLATTLAIAALILLVAVTRYDAGTFVAAVLALNFYTLGRRRSGRDAVPGVAALLGFWLVGAVIISYVPPGGSAGVVLEAWVVCGVLPFAVGHAIAFRSTLAHELEAAAGRLEDEHAVRARRAAGGERNRMARELHDVIAHNVSVMVIQASAARRVARRDLEEAREALSVVESSGRDALVELRRLVGVLRRGSDQLVGSGAPGLSQLDALVERARAAGVPVELHLDGPLSRLSPGLDLVAYRVVQEALTNTIKHAGGARATVTVTVTADELNIAVSDNGAGPSARPNGSGVGHGLLGMSERVALYGGEVQCGQRVSDGFEVHATIPLDGATTPATRAPQSDGWTGWEGTATDRLPWPWLDPVLAAILLIVLEVSVITSSHRHGPLVASVVLIAAMPLAALRRRRSPVLFVVTIFVIYGLVSHLVSLDSAVPGIYFGAAPAYTIAAWTGSRTAVIVIAIMILSSAFGELIVDHGTWANYAGEAFFMGASWTAGRAIRARRLLTTELQRTNVRLEIEREDRARLAVAGERSRIARELHAAVAQTVTAMVVQTEAAGALLRRDPAQAGATISTIEDTGRETLREMRRILGVLRHTDEVGEREPQPGVDQIYPLIQSTREHGQHVELTVHGDPGTLPAGIDIGLYRILEDALDTIGRRRGPVGVVLRFGEEDLELQIIAGFPAPSRWPTDAMRERVALCGGQFEVDESDAGGWKFAARMPRGLQGTLL